MEQAVEASSPEVRAPWHMLRRGTTKIAFSLQELVALTSDFSLKWAKNCNSQVLRTDRAKYLFVYRVTCHKKDSDPNGHVVRLKFDFAKMKETGTVDDLDVRATCSCPAFLYWGPQWNLGTGDALYGAPRPKFQPPTDPKRYQFVICKHVKIVADRIGPALERLLDHHRNLKDRAQQDQNLKDVQLEKQRAQQTVEDLTQQTKAPVPDTTPQNPNAPAIGEPTQKGPVKTWGPEETGDLTLPSQAPVLPPAPKPSPGTLLPPKTRETLGLPPAPSAPVIPPGPKGKLVAPNITVHEEDEGEPTILPGNKGKLVVDQLQHPNVFVHDDDDDSTTILPGRQPKVVRDETTTGRKLPPNIQLVDEDEDEPIKINSALRRLAAMEPGEPGRCYWNAARWAMDQDLAGVPDVLVVHGTLVNIEGKRIDHAWVEVGPDRVVDPTTGFEGSKQLFYQVAQARPDAKYPPEHAYTNTSRAGHQGPWRPDEQFKPSIMASGRLGSLVLASATGRLGRLVVAACAQTSSPTS